MLTVNMQDPYVALNFDLKFPTFFLRDTFFSLIKLLGTFSERHRVEKGCGAAGTLIRC